MYKELLPMIIWIRQRGQCYAENHKTKLFFSSRKATCFKEPSKNTQVVSMSIYGNVRSWLF